MNPTFASIFSSSKYIIAAVHFLPLPGSPLYDREGGVKKIIQRAKRDAQILADQGVSALLFTNEADMPYVQRLPQEGLAAFTAIVQEVKQNISIPFGVNALIDAMAGHAIAHATGASFIRGLFSGNYSTNMGIIETQGPAIFRERANLGSRTPYFLHNLSSILGPQLVDRSPEEEARSIVENTLVEAFTLPACDPLIFQKVKAAAGGLPLVVGSGTSFSNVQSLLENADGAVIASCLHEDGKLLNPVDAERTARFMKLVRPILD